MLFIYIIKERRLYSWENFCISYSWKPSKTQKFSRVNLFTITIKRITTNDQYNPSHYLLIYRHTEHIVFIKQSYIVVYFIAQNFDGGKFWRFWHFPARPLKFNSSNFLKTIQRLQVYGEIQWPSIKIFSVKYLKSEYPSKFPSVKMLHYMAS